MRVKNFVRADKDKVRRHSTSERQKIQTNTWLCEEMSLDVTDFDSLSQDVGWLDLSHLSA